MTKVIDASHVESAMARFKAFFTELHETFIERDEVLTQCALALLSRQHVLMTGPPGTAKSQLASMILRRVICEVSGEPSLFARQFTESTVQTDLIGPLNFKTLMESGRTEHFTDEGILGSVHAFLDEVFDGRDMLLRSTLNLLQEREFKQGGTTAKGQIECAFMTTNRYIAEILDSSRETLLAFIDRISFVSFVPRGFADPASMETVVRRHGGGFGRHKPVAALSVQDLDILQAATDLTYVPEEICDAVAELVRGLDTELLEARRYDPKFQPTRYLSTRSAVQAANVLRAVAVYDRIFHNTTRRLEVNYGDLDGLRYFFLLAGLSRDAIAQCLERESDPRERRQLDIMRSEAEIFDRSLAKLPRKPIQKQARTLNMDSLRKMVDHAVRSGDPDTLADTVHELIGALESGAPDANHAADLLVETVGNLSRKALTSGLRSSLPVDKSLQALAVEIIEVAGNLERAAGNNRPLAQWLRGRLLALLDDSLRLARNVEDESIQLLLSDPDPKALGVAVEARVGELESTHALRSSLIAAGAEVDDPARSDEGWLQAVSDAEEQIALLSDSELRATAVSILAAAQKRPLSEVLVDLRPTVARLDELAKRLERLGVVSELKRRVLGPRLEPLVSRALGSLSASDRRVVVREVQTVLEELASAGLEELIEPTSMVGWIAPLLVKDARSPKPEPIRTRQQFDAARAAEPEISITEALVEIAIAALPQRDRKTDAPDETTTAVWNVLRGLSDVHKRAIITKDLERVERRLGHLLSWWTALTAERAEAEASADKTVELLESVVQSGFLRVVRSEREPLRLALETERLAEVFPNCSEQAMEVRKRIERLDAQSTQVIVGLLEGHADRAWSRALEQN